jgi:sigma-B regulation protein RsbU (phosphoserine phosphatase)
VKILIAEDEPLSRRLLQHVLTEHGHDVIVTSDGIQAWEVLQSDDAPHLAVVDWMMPGLTGLQLCNLVHEAPDADLKYLILLTAKGEKADIVRGLAAGANDYVTKPFDKDELRARVEVGVRMIQLQIRLADRIRELQEALAHVNQLKGIIPICAQCKKIRDDQNYWQRVEKYIAKNVDAKFTHGLCPDCAEAVRIEADQMVSGGGIRPAQRFPRRNDANR